MKQEKKEILAIFIKNGKKLKFKMLKIIFNNFKSITT